MIDLRSDTLTRPTAAMRRAMAEAQVGDDVYGEDPTVRALEARAAERTGKEAALYVASGTLANQLAIKVWTQPGQQVVLDEHSHIMLYERAAAALICGVVLAPVAAPQGWYGPAQLPPGLAGGATGTGLVCAENTHNRMGGAVWPQGALAALGEACRARGVPLHLDGARLFNAAVSQGLPAAELARPADSLMFCLSKGLACPVGSLLCGPAAFIAQARRLRAVLGGAMRQAGIVAAAGLVALDEMVERLADDHRRARRLADGLAQFAPLRLDPRGVRTNIVVFELERPRAAALVDRLGEQEVRCLAVEPAKIRMVVHYEIDDTGIERTIQTVGRCLASLPDGDS